MEKLIYKKLIVGFLEANKMPKKSSEILAHLSANGIQIMPRQLRKLINELRAEIPFLMSTQKGYSIGYDATDVFTAIVRMDKQIQSMKRSRNILSAQLEKSTGFVAVLDHQTGEYELCHIDDIPHPVEDADIFEDLEQFLSWENRAQ